MTKTALTLALLLAAAPFGVRPAMAQDDAPKSQFTGNIGYVSTGGNTSVSTLNIGDRFVIQTPDKGVVFTQTLNLVYGKADGEKNAENYRAGLRLDYSLGGSVYLFALTGWDRNVFGGIARRFEETVGVAYRAVELPSDELTLEFGLSLFQQRNVVSSNGFDDNYAAGRAGVAYRHTFNKTTFVSQDLEFIPNFETGSDWRLNSETAIVAPISTSIGLKVGYVVRYDNLPGLLPPPNTALARLEKTDRFFTAGLTISF